MSLLMQETLSLSKFTNTESHGRAVATINGFTPSTSAPRTRQAGSYSELVWGSGFVPDRMQVVKGVVSFSSISCGSSLKRIKVILIDALVADLRSFTAVTF